jgi:hypothetical protein
MEDRNHDIPQVTQEENDELVAELSEAEVREAVFQLEYNEAPRPDGLPAEFYQVFWLLIKDDLMDLFWTLIERN